MRAVEHSGPERRTCGFPLHEIDHWDGPACAGGPSAFIFVPSVSAHHLLTGAIPTLSLLLLTDPIVVLLLAFNGNNKTFS